MKVSNILKEFPELTFQAGSQDALVDSPDHPATEKTNALVFIGNKEDMELAIQSSATVCLCHPSLVEMAQSHFGSENRALLSHDNVVLQMSLINTKFFSYTRHLEPFDAEHAIHPTAVIHQSVKYGKNLVVGPNTTIGEGCVLGDNCSIGPNTTIESHCRLGSHVRIHAQVYIGFQTQIGHGCEIHPQTSIGTEGYGYSQDKEWNHYRIPHLGICVLEDDVHIGAGVCLDRGTYKNSIIGKGTKIDNHCHLAHNHEVGKKGLITAGFIVAGSTQIGDNFMAGGRTSVNGHLKVTDNVRIGGLSVITKSVEEPGSYAGYPLQDHKDHLRSQAMISKLPEFKRILGKIKKKLDL